MIRRYRSTYEGCALVPLVTSSIGDSELIIHFQEAYARFFPNCYNKQGIQSNLPSYRPINQGTICAKVHPEGIQPIMGSNFGLILIILISVNNLAVQSLSGTTFRTSVRKSNGALKEGSSGTMA